MSILSTLLGISEAALQYQKFDYEKSKDRALTGAQVQQNEFAAQQANLSYQRELEADSTKYQRQVADMQAAGLNPMLAAGQSAGAVHSSPASPGTPVSSNLSGISLSGLLQYQLQKEQLKIQRDIADADIKKKESETAGIDLDSEFKRITMESRSEAQRLANSLTRSKISEVNKAIDEMDSSIRLMREQADSEASRRSLNLSQALLASASAQQIVELLPYEKAYKLASTANQKQAALLAAAHAAYQNKLLTDGYIDAFISAAQSEAGIKLNEKEVSDVRTALRTGEPKGAFKDTGFNRFALEHLLSPLVTVLDNFNPISNLFK